MSRAPVRRALIAGVALGWAGSLLAIVTPEQRAGAQTATHGTPVSTTADVPRPPEDIVKAKAYGVFKRYCARCHQAGVLDPGGASGGFANVLALDELTRDPARVRPGVPDGSSLYTVLLTRFGHAHLSPRQPDRTTEQAKRTRSRATRRRGGRRPRAHRTAEPVAEPPARIRRWPERAEIHLVRDWIANLSPRGSTTCPQRARITPSAIAQTVTQALAGVEPDRAKLVRFLSLAHLYNACVPADELGKMRQAITVLLNVLSRRPKVVVPRALGPQQLVFMVSLDAIGWSRRDWAAVAARYPLRAEPNAQLPPRLQAQTGTAVPMILADWLADQALRPPLYATVLGLPPAFNALALQLGADIAGASGFGGALNLRVVASQELVGSRLLERRPQRGGGLWLAHPLISDAPAGDVGSGANGADQPRRPRHIGSSRGFNAWFHLPNGFPAFRVIGTDGRQRSDWSIAGPSHNAGPRPTSSLFARCLTCHALGARATTPAVAAGPHLSAPMGDDVSDDLGDAVGDVPARVGLPAGQLARQITADQGRAKQAWTAANVDPEARLWGLGLIEALGHAWRRPANALRTAADLGISAARLRARLDVPDRDAPVAARQLRQGVARRAAIIRSVFPRACRPSHASCSRAGKLTQPVDAGLDLAVWTERQAVSAGQLADFSVKASQDCFLTLINVDTRGRATVLFPNDYHRDNKIAAGRLVTIPPADAGYRFRFADRGRELIVAICSMTRKAPASIVHNYERLRFTVLGDWALFLRSPPRLDKAGLDDAATPWPRGERRRRGARPRSQPKHQPPIATDGNDQAWAAATINVR